MTMHVLWMISHNFKLCYDAHLAALFSKKVYECLWKLRYIQVMHFYERYASYAFLWKLCIFMKDMQVMHFYERYASYAFMKVMNVSMMLWKAFKALWCYDDDDVMKRWFLG